MNNTRRKALAKIAEQIEELKAQLEDLTCEKAESSSSLTEKHSENFCLWADKYLRAERLDVILGREETYNVFIEFYKKSGKNYPNLCEFTHLIREWAHAKGYSFFSKVFYTTPIDGMQPFNGIFNVMYINTMR